MDITNFFNDFPDDAAELYRLKKKLLFSDKGLRISAYAKDLREINVKKDKNGFFSSISLRYVKTIFNKRHIVSMNSLSGSNFQRNLELEVRKHCESIQVYGDESLTCVFSLNFNAAGLPPLTHGNTLTFKVENHKLHFHAKEATEENNKSLATILSFLSKNQDVYITYKIDKESEMRLELEKSARLNLSNDYYSQIIMKAIKEDLTARSLNFKDALTTFSQKTIDLSDDGFLALIDNYDTSRLSYKMRDAVNVAKTYKKCSQYFFSEDFAKEELIDQLNFRDLLKNKGYKNPKHLLKDLKMLGFSIINHNDRNAFKDQIKHYKKEVENLKIP